MPASRPTPGPSRGDVRDPTWPCARSDRWLERPRAVARPRWRCRGATRSATGLRRLTRPPARRRVVPRTARGSTGCSVPPRRTSAAPGSTGSPFGTRTCETMPAMRGSDRHAARAGGRDDAREAALGRGQARAAGCRDRSAARAAGAPAGALPSPAAPSASPRARPGPWRAAPPRRRAGGGHSRRPRRWARSLPSTSPFSIALALGEPELRIVEEASAGRCADHQLVGARGLHRGGQLDLLRERALAPTTPSRTGSSTAVP